MPISSDRQKQILPSNLVSIERVFKKELIDRGWIKVEIHLEAQIYQRRGNWMICSICSSSFLNCTPIDRAGFQLPVAYLKLKLISKFYDHGKIINDYTFRFTPFSENQSQRGTKKVAYLQLYVELALENFFPSLSTDRMKI